MAELGTELQPTSDDDLAGMVRLSININQETAKVLHDFMEKNGTATETLHQAIIIVHHLVSEQLAGRRILIADKRARPFKEVILTI